MLFNFPYIYCSVIFAQTLGLQLILICDFYWHATYTFKPNFFLHCQYHAKPDIECQNQTLPILPTCHVRNISVVVRRWEFSNNQHKIFQNEIYLTLLSDLSWEMKVTCLGWFWGGIHWIMAFLSTSIAKCLYNNCYTKW